MADSILEGVSQELVLFNSNLPALMNAQFESNEISTNVEDAQFESIEGVFETLKEVNGTAMDLMSETLLRIEGILLSFLDVIPASIESASQNQIATALDLSDDELDAEALADKKKKRSKDPDNKGGSKFISAFNKGKDDASEEGIEDLIDSIFPISAIMGSLGGAFAILTTTILPMVPMILAIGVAIAAVVNGLMTAFDYFNSKEGTLGEKLLAGIEGFFQGMAAVITKPLDFIKDAMSGLLKSVLGEDNILSKMLDSFSYFDVFSDIIRTIFGVIGDVIELMQPVTDFVVDHLKTKFLAAKVGIEMLVDGISKFIDWIMSIGRAAASLLGIDLPEAKEIEKPKIVELDNTQGREARKTAEDSGLYNESFIYGIDSKIDESKLGDATLEQLQAIVDQNDLTDDDMQKVVDQLNKIAGTSPSSDPTLAAIKTTAKTSTPEEAAQAEVNAAASKKKRDAQLASVPPEELAAIKAEMGLGTSDVEVVSTPQHELNQFAAQQRESHRRINEKYAAPIPELETEPSSAFASIQQEEKDYQANRKKKGTVATAIKRDPVTGMPLAGSFKAPAGSEGSVFTVLDPVSGEVQTFDDFERASMFAAANEMDVKTVPKASVSGAGNSLAASHQMQAGTTKMNDGNAQLAQGNSGGNVAVNAPTTSTTNVKNTTHRGAIPTAMDKSDRTDRRGRSRGTG